MGKSKVCSACGAVFLAGPRDYGQRWERRTFCSRGCRNKVHKRTESLVDRFWAKVQRSPDKSACWPWTAAVDSFGYGRVWTGDRVDGSNRVAWELEKGPIPKGEGYHGLCVLHRCDNPRCCNPDHLFLGSNATNLRDMTAKGRHGMAKLDVAAVLEIRRRHKAGEATQTDLAKAYGMSKGMISLIVNRKNWQHI